MRTAFVGGGIGSLTAALLLAKQGVSVTIYEQSERLGGRLAYREGQGFKVDQGPTIVLLPEMLLSILEEAGIPRSRLPLLECDPMYDIHYADGTVLRKHRNEERQAEELERLFPGAGAGYRRYMKETRPLYREGKRAFLDRAFIRKKEFYTPANLALLYKFKAYRSARHYASRYFDREELIDAYSLQTLYIGGIPFRSPALYTLLPFAEHEYGVWYLKGGYAGLVDIMREELERAGVNVVLNTRVDQLLVQDGRCVGIAARGEKRKYDSVVYNGDFPNMRSLLPRSPKTTPKSYTPSTGCVLIYLGLNRRYEAETAHSFFLPSSLAAGLREIAAGEIPGDPSFYVFYPTAIDPDAATEGQSVMYVLVPVPALGRTDWKRDTPGLAERVLEAAEQRGFPGLRESVAWMEIRTPEDAAAEGLYQGGSFGIAPTLAQSAVFRPQIVPSDLSGLYAVGASVHPGGGIPIVMQGAKLLANHIAKESRSHVDSALLDQMRRDDSSRFIHVP
jgi:phytoene desaturase